LSLCQVPLSLPINLLPILLFSSPPIFFYIEVKKDGGIERVIEGENEARINGGIEGRIQ
jgi:hypothetical protein